MLVVPLLGLLAHWPYNNRSHYFIAHDYVENIQSTIEPNSLLLTLDWQVASPMLYTREIEQRRRDIKAIDVQLLRRSWYFDYLRRSYPGLIERSRDKVDAYVDELKKMGAGSRCLRAKYRINAADRKRFPANAPIVCQQRARDRAGLCHGRVNPD
jgi:hypothetical protein